MQYVLGEKEGITFINNSLFLVHKTLKGIKRHDMNLQVLITPQKSFYNQYQTYSFYETIVAGTAEKLNTSLTQIYKKNAFWIC